MHSESATYDKTALTPESVKRIGFGSEGELIRAIIACAARAGRRDYRVEPEVNAGVGIADLLLVKRAPRSSKSLRALGSVSPRLAVLLRRGVGDEIKSRAELATVLGTSENAAQRVIALLTAVGLAKQSRNSLVISTVNTPPYDHLIAVEAKISNWQGVLVQAYRNLQFADESWVVLDHAYVRPALAQIGRFRVAGVGLASVDRRKSLFVHHPALTQGPMSLGKRWQAQAVLASRHLARRIASGAD
jgi:hypothetical protein